MSENTKNLPILKFNGEECNAHELLEGIPYVFGHTRTRSKRVWIKQEDALTLFDLFNTQEYFGWGEVEIQEEQNPYQSGWTNGRILKTNETFIVPQKCSRWSVVDASTLN